ncbi:SCP2 sterol-binding domain-containing protein [Amycolatopsis cynarae]|uniref:SCP2 sterol-binding domain-containing protein n=1 Tax=Amycolatopsis cynarae TaxID=2995223 RepID=A0ABY7BAJ2_9PSEU|nr:SCP2 sterol-binding domain-containing protein [Amycolatopsis sp. HUAS 11-8]WAL67718.1 SCP2 sterol-binding domain-containing protein [Amycolatopsis sp. HUAS 11-8]
MGFSSADEVRRYLGGVFETAFADPEIGPKLRDTGLVLRFAYSAPDTSIVIDCGQGAVLDADADPETNATMSMSAETGNAYWQGKVNLPLAMAKGKIRVEGNVASLLKLAPLSKRFFPVYVETLRADGRDDLVV